MKPRSDSILKLRAIKSPEFGEKVIEWLHEPAQRDENNKPIPRTGGAWHAREQLAADGIKVNDSTLSDFYSWWELRKDFSEAETHTEDLIELLKHLDPNITAEKLEVAGQLIFTKEALKKRDQPAFVEMGKLKLAKETAVTKGRQKDEELKIAWQRLREKIDMGLEELHDEIKGNAEALDLFNRMRAIIRKEMA